MVYVDTTKSGRELKPGVDLWRVAECVYKKPDGKDPRFNLKLKRVSDEGDHLYDLIMLAGPGFDIGKKKLQGLGIPVGFQGDIDPLQFVGMSVWVETGLDTYEGKERLKVNIAGLKCSGYQPAEDVPPGHALPDLTDLGDEHPAF